MLAKVIAHAGDRATALDLLHASLRETICLGVGTNIDDLADILEDPRVRAGDMDTSLLADHVVREATATTGTVAAAAQALLPQVEDTAWGAGDSWRLGGPTVQRWTVGDAAVDIARTQTGPVTTIDGARVEPDVVDGAVLVDSRLWTHAGGRHYEWLALRMREQRLRDASEALVAGAWVARSPMPGAVIDVLVTPGSRVAKGDALVVVEAMKMEHIVRAPATGTVVEVVTATDSRVPLDAPLVHLLLEDTP
jgi:acetyl-CoA/propionyl-CoA carboxylase, biotin carboxylase, biotin carboxyl carrier protein